MYLKRLQPFFCLGALYILVSFILRFVFIFHPITTSNFSIWECTKVLSIGLVNDFFIFVLASSLFVLYTLFLSNSKYNKPWGKIILAIFVLAILYVAFYPNNIFKQYGGSVITGLFRALGLRDIPVLVICNVFLAVFTLTFTSMVLSIILSKGKELSFR